MFIQPYQAGELHFAYCYRVFLRWRTLRGQPRQELSKLNLPVLSALANKYGIHVLECASDATDLLAQVSLKPTETISSCVSKLKGQVSKWLREELQLEQPADLVSKGYFACTAGKSTREAVEQYLNQQSEHHGYAQRVLPPIYTCSYELSDDIRMSLMPRSRMTFIEMQSVRL